MKKIILLSAFILTIAFGLCGCKKDDATVHFAPETEQKAVVSSDVNRQTADSKEKKASSDGEQEQKAKDTKAVLQRLNLQILILLNGVSIFADRSQTQECTE